MFKNRSFLVKMVKDDNTQIVPILDNTPPPDYNALADKLTKNVIAIIACWVGADTARRSIIYILSAKL